MNGTALSFQPHNNAINRRNSKIIPNENISIENLHERFEFINSLTDKVLINGLEGVKAAITMARTMEEDFGLTIDIDAKRFKELSEKDLDSLKDLQATVANFIETIPKRTIALIIKHYADLHEGTENMPENRRMKYGYEQWLKHKIELNIDQIWKDYKGIDKLLTTEKEYLLNNNKLSIYSALVNMITGDYVKRAWSNTEDPEVLANVVVSVNANLALTGALIVTLAFPIYSEITPEDYAESDLGIVFYAYGLLGCGVFESVALLVAVRNMIAVNLLKPENLRNYVIRSNGILLSPMGFNVIGITSLLIALLALSYRNQGDLFLIIFSMAIVFPGLVCIFGISAVGITHIYEVQPWHSTHVDDVNDHKFIDDEVKKIKQSNKDKIKNNEFYPVNT